MRVSFSETKNKDPEIRSGVKIPYAPGKRRVSKLLWWLILAFVFAPLVALLWYIFAGWFFSSSPGIISMESFPIRSPEKALIAEMLVSKGSNVVSGAVAARLIRLPSSELLDRIELMKAERDSIKSGLDKTAKNPQKSLKLTEQNIAFYRKEADTMRYLMEQGAATRAEVNQAEAQLRAAMAESDALVLSSTGDTADGTITSRIDYFNKSINYLEKIGGSSFDVVIKREGRVQSIEAFSGQTVDEGDELLWVADPKSARVVVYVEPENFKNIKLDSEVKVVMPGRSRKINAILEEMPTISQSTPGGLANRISVSTRSVKVYLTLKEPLIKEELVDGLPVKVEWGPRFFF